MKPKGSRAELANIKELKRLQRENAEMREVLADYYAAETEYGYKTQLVYYGRYRLAADRLVALAKKVSDSTKLKVRK